LQPALKTQLAIAAPGTIVHLLVVFRSEDRLPRLPLSSVQEADDTPANQAAARERATIIDRVRQTRQRAADQRQGWLGRDYHASIREVFWIADILALDLPAAAVESLSRRDDVLYVSGSDSYPPPQALTPNVDHGRALIRSEFLNTLPSFFAQTYVHIGLLDSGVYRDHQQLTGPSRIGIWRDCYNGTLSNCTAGGTLNPSDVPLYHGTSTAAIITANANQGTAYRGISTTTVDSFKVTDNIGTVQDAVLRGFQAATAAGVRIILGEMQHPDSDVGPLSVAADSAYDAGITVVATNGNQFSGYVYVASPANAHKALGVGAIDVDTGATTTDQRIGPAPDGRIKPDVQAPTNVWTAMGTGPADLRRYGGTSGAGPFAAAATALVYHAFCDCSCSCGYLTPGHMMAHMIMRGSTSAFNNTSGVGLLRLPTNYGSDDFGSVTISNGQVIDIDLGLPTASCTGGPAAAKADLQAAIWWPETPSQTHNVIYLSLVDPNGIERSPSQAYPSVFQRSNVDGQLASGTWMLRIYGAAVSSPQLVYYASYARDLNCP
jgi:serine protease AprX